MLVKEPFSQKEVCYINPGISALLATFGYSEVPSCEKAHNWTISDWE